MARRWHYSLAFVYLVLGLLLATSFNAQEKARELSQTPRKQELISKIHRLERERDEEKRRIEKYRESLNRYERAAAASEGVLQAFNRDLSVLKLEAGLTKVKGKGLRITLADNPKPPSGENTNANNYIIHDYDLRTVVNSLWSGGAEAISINGQRLVSTSAIRCAGNTILVNSNRLASPYVISAIGDPQKLEDALKSSKETDKLMNEVAKAFGLVANVEKASILIPAYEGGIYSKEGKIKGSGR